MDAIQNVIDLPFNEFLHAQKQIRAKELKLLGCNNGSENMHFINAFWAKQYFEYHAKNVDKCKILLQQIHDYFLKQAPEHYKDCGLCVDIANFLNN